VWQAQVAGSGGDPRLDELALRLTEVALFSPAYHGSRPLAVHAMIPVLFEVTD
jgi:outer membrane biosynthesis protein TonB